MHQGWAWGQAQAPWRVGLGMWPRGLLTEGAWKAGSGAATSVAMAKGQA